METQARCVKIASFAVVICPSTSRSRREVSRSLVWQRSKVEGAGIHERWRQPPVFMRFPEARFVRFAVVDAAEVSEMKHQHPLNKLARMRRAKDMG